MACSPSNPWGFNPDDKPPEARELFPAADEEFRRTAGMEDFLQHNNVFVNGISGKTAHADSYMTIVQHTEFLTALKLLENTYAPTKEDWQVLVNLWLGNPNTQPPLKMISSFLVAEFDLVRPTINLEDWKL